MKITKIQRKPWWMFWTVNQWVVTVKLDSGIERAVAVYDSPPFIPGVFLGYVTNKVLYGVQFDDDVKRVREERQARAREKEHRNLHLEHLRSLVGTTISETESKQT